MTADDIRQKLADTRILIVPYCHPDWAWTHTRAWHEARYVHVFERVLEIWRECLSTYGGPYLFGERSMADAMYAPVVTRLQTYDVRVADKACAAYCQRIMAMPELREWIEAAKLEPEDIDELEMEF